MAHQIPTTEPANIEAGDLVKWTKSLEDYLFSDGWTLKYWFLTHDGDSFSITAVVDPNNAAGYLVSVPPSVSTNWVAGTYYWESYVTDSSLNRHKVDSGVAEVSGDISKATTLDNRTDARIILDTLIALVKDRAGRPEKSYTLQAAGRSFTYHSLDEIQKAIQYWKGKVMEEEEQAAIDKGEGAGNRILTRFVSP